MDKQSLPIRVASLGAKSSVRGCASRMVRRVYGVGERSMMWSNAVFVGVSWTVSVVATRIVQQGMDGGQGNSKGCRFSERVGRWRE